MTSLRPENSVSPYRQIGTISASNPQVNSAGMINKSNPLQHEPWTWTQQSPIYAHLAFS
jgi:hypothetical protein